MTAPEEEIERKLIELEASLKEDPQQQLSVPAKSSQPSVNDDVVKSDLYITMGSCLLLLGVLLFFNHVRLGTSFFTNLFGMGQAGFGLILIPLMIGAGILLYDYKKRIGWIITAASCALIFFSVLSRLVMTFPSMSLLGMIMMLLPLAGGAALLVKGIKQRPSGAK